MTHPDRKMRRKGVRVLFDMQRMQKALAGPSVTLPDDLKTREEIRAFILGAAAAFEAAGLSSPPLMKEEE